MFCKDLMWIFKDFIEQGSALEVDFYGIFSKEHAGNWILRNICEGILRRTFLKDKLKIVF